MDGINAGLTCSGTAHCEDNLDFASVNSELDSSDDEEDTNNDDDQDSGIDNDKDVERPDAADAVDATADASAENIHNSHTPNERYVIGTNNHDDSNKAISNEVMFVECNNGGGIVQRCDISI
jgi:hypothetical protein